MIHSEHWLHLAQIFFPKNARNFWIYSTIVKHVTAYINQDGTPPLFLAKSSPRDVRVLQENAALHRKRASMSLLHHPKIIRCLCILPKTLIHGLKNPNPWLEDPPSFQMLHTLHNQNRVGGKDLLLLIRR